MKSALLLLPLLLTAAPLAAADTSALHAEHVALRRAHAAALEAVAAKCDELGMPSEAARTRGWILPDAAGRRLAFLDRPAPPAEPANAPERVRQWRNRFDQLRRQQAEALVKLMERAEAEGDSALAYRLACEALREDPEAAEARRRIGARAEIGRPRVSTLPHADFRWPARSFQRLETDHFSIATNQSAAAAVELGRLLEDLYCVWRQLFHPTREEGSRRKHRVVLFRDREEYIAALRPLERQIDLTLGVYLDGPETSYFFGPPSESAATICHEATHQLFRECLGSSPAAGREGNFWAIEGVALYLESAVPGEAYWSLGGFEADRLQFARYRALNEKFHLPLAELVQLGRSDLQGHAEIRELYSESAGLAHFFMHGREGAYREAFNAYLGRVYSLRDRPDTLTTLCGAEYAELDRQYLEFLSITDADLAQLTAPATRTNLALGHTEVTDAGLAHLAACTELNWLDLTNCPVTDAGLKHLRGLTKLERLTLEGTGITSAGLAELAGLTQLKELDLSRTKIDDEGLRALAGLTNLETLWLTGTEVSDAGLPHLARLRKLEYVDVSGSRVTQQGWQQLVKQLPKLGEP